MKRTTKGKIFKISALVLDVGAPLAATVSQFPVWVDRSAGATVSGLFVLFALLSAIPFFKQIKAYFKSPSVWVMWCIILVALVALRAIIDEMIVICLIGAAANVIGTGLYKLGDHFDPPQNNGGGSAGGSP
jgi:phosphatidylserine synthase|nr:MAG TPA: hypothetical protein [Caudoviricetes sp.]